MKRIIFVMFFVVILAFGVAPSDVLAVQFDATAIPKGAFYFKIYPNVFVTGGKFDDSGNAVNFTHLSTLSYVDTSLECYYGITGSLMSGVLLPVGYIGKNHPEKTDFSTTKMKNPWLIVKHQFWSEVVCSASSLRIKIPITEIEPLEEGFDIDDKQIDLYPVYYLDWTSSLGVYIYRIFSG